MMATLKQLSSKTVTGPYNKPVKLKVCGIATKTSYTNSAGESKESITVGFADNTQAIKGIVYATSLMSNIQEGDCVLVFNPIVKPDLSQIVLTKQSKMIKTAQFDVPKELFDQGRLHAFPPPLPVTPLAKVANSPVKTLMTVQGQVVSEEMTSKVPVRGGETDVKNITLKDGATSCKVALWRQFAQNPPKVGKFIKLENVVTNFFQAEMTLSSTSRTTYTEIEVPQSEITETIIGLQIEEERYLVTMDETYATYSIDPSLLAQYLDCPLDQIEEKLLSSIPLKVKLTLQNNSVVSLTKV